MITPGAKTSEFFVAIFGIASAVIPVVLDKVPAGSVWAVILGALLAASTYIAGRTVVKATATKADAYVAAAKDPTVNP